MKNFNDDYYAGFDIGTDSVGYAVADTCRFSHKLKKLFALNKKF